MADSVGSVIGPEIPADITPLVVAQGDLRDEYSEVAIDGAQLAGTEIENLCISQSRLAKVNLTESNLGRLQVTDCELDECNFSNVGMPGGSFWRVVVSGSKLSGLHVSKATFTDVEFRGCRLDFSSFAEVKFKSVTFNDCQIREADFSKATFELVRFVECDLTRASFGHIKIRNSEMRRCVLTGLRGLTELRGIAMEWNDILGNAELFAQAIGIEIAKDGPA